MANQITINAKALEVKEYSGQRVVTFKDIDAVHDRPEGTARRNFNANRKYFIEGEDFFTINQPDEIRTLGITRPQGGTPSSVTILTESGYYMLVKSFTDDLSWEVQRELKNNYFRARANALDYSALSPQLQFMIQMEQRQNALESAVKTTNRRIDDICETMQVKGVNWRKATHSLVNRIASASGNEQREIYLDIYDELELRAGVNLSVRFENLVDRLYERGVSDSRINRLNYVDVIAEDKKLTEIYIAIVKEMAVRYNAC